MVDNMTDDIRRRTTHVLYRYFNKKNELLYVGITNDIMNRAHAHSRDKSWYRQCAYSTMQHFKSREALAAAEVYAIQTEKPKYNQAHAGSTVKPVQMRWRNINKARGSAFGHDASHFKAPDAIAADDDDEIDDPPELVYNPQDTGGWQYLPLGFCCDDCFRMPLAHLPETGLVYCHICGWNTPLKEWLLHRLGRRVRPMEV